MNMRVASKGAARDSITATHAERWRKNETRAVLHGDRRLCTTDAWGQRPGLRRTAGWRRLLAEHR